MTMRLAWASAAQRHSGRPRQGRLSRPTGDHEHPGWRSHTFGDGVRSLTLVGPLDVGLAGRLWARVSELMERGARRLIVDARGIALTSDEPALLAAVFAGRPASCQTVVVAPAGSSLLDMLPASVGTTRSLTEAHRQLMTGIVRHEAGRRPGPGARIPAEERHALAIRQSLRWAERAAREGDYERALSWLSTVERVDGRLPDGWRRQREVWLAAWAAQSAQPPCRRLGRR